MIWKLALCLSLLSSISPATEEKSGDLAEHKAMISKNIDNKIALLQSKKSCIQDAVDHESIKKCHEAAQGEREKLKKDRKDFRIQKIDERIKKLEEKKLNN